MIEKRLKLVLTFHTTTAAMAMESACTVHALPGRLIPVPREIASGCGMAWCSLPENQAELEQLAKAEGIQIAGSYQMML